MMVMGFTMAKSWSHSGIVDTGTRVELEKTRTVVASVAVTWEDEARWGEVGGDRAAGYVHAQVRDRRRTARGLGGALLGWAEARIRARGRRFSRLDIQTASTRLVHYYEEHGYRAVGSGTLPGHSPLTLFEKRLS